MPSLCITVLHEWYTGPQSLFCILEASKGAEKTDSVR